MYVFAWKINQNNLCIFNNPLEYLHFKHVCNTVYHAITVTKLEHIAIKIERLLSLGHEPYFKGSVTNNYYEYSIKTL